MTPRAPTTTPRLPADIAARDGTHLRVAATCGGSPRLLLQTVTTTCVVDLGPEATRHLQAALRQALGEALGPASPAAVPPQPLELHA